MKQSSPARSRVRDRADTPPPQPLREALLVTLKHTADKGRPSKKLQAIADKLVELAMKGDLYAIREIFDRIDGPVAPKAENARKTQR